MKHAGMGIVDLVHPPQLAYVANSGGSKNAATELAALVGRVAPTLLKPWLCARTYSLILHA